MSVDIGRVFSNSFTMVKDRWLAMVALWATFIGFLIVYGIAFFALVGGSMMAMVGSFDNPAAFDDPAMLGGMGIGFVLMLIVFYIGYIAIALGQQASMVAYASPLHRINFGEAFGRGLKGGLTLLGVFVLLMIAGIVFGLVFALFAAMMSFLDTVGIAITYLIALVLGVYLMCRFMVIVPVIVVERVYNPIAAINRTWSVTSGKVLSMLVVLIAFVVLAFVVLIPFSLIMGGMIGFTDGGGAGVASVILALFLSLIISFAFALLYCALIASLHAEVSDTQATEFGKTFE